MGDAGISIGRPRSLPLIGGGQREAARTEMGQGGAKTFRGDLLRMVSLVEQRRPFAFARFGDGEWRTMRNQPLDITGKGHGEFRYSPENALDRAARSALIQSFHYSAEGYFAGIGCLCCWRREKLLQMRKICTHPDARLTWANLWGNSNYPVVRDRLVPLFRQFDDIYLVSHGAGDPARLPFSLRRRFPIGTNAWTADLSLADRLADFVADTDLRGALFLFCAGPLANILAWRCHAANPHNTYLDFGSVLDPWLFGRKRFQWLDKLAWMIPSPGVTRGYLKPGKKRRQTCRWWDPDPAELAATPLDLPVDMTPAREQSVRRAA